MEGPSTDNYGGDNATRFNNASVGSVPVIPTDFPEGFEFRFIYEGVLLTCVTMFGLVSNVIAVVVLLRSEMEKEGQQSKISLPCWAVLTSLPVSLSSLWASPLLLFSAKDQFEKERHEVQRSWYIPARE